VLRQKTFETGAPPHLSEAFAYIRCALVLASEEGIVGEGLNVDGIGKPFTGKAQIHMESNGAYESPFGSRPVAEVYL